MEFPYGLSDFGTLIGAGYFYQDRTDRIPQLEKAGRQLNLRPSPPPRQIHRNPLFPDALQSGLSLDQRTAGQVVE